jgi:hypothetical protein
MPQEAVNSYMPLGTRKLLLDYIFKNITLQMLPRMSKTTVGKVILSIRVNQNCRFAGFAPRCLAAGAAQKPTCVNSNGLNLQICTFAAFSAFSEEKKDPVPQLLKITKIKNRTQNRTFVKCMNRKSKNRV